MAKVYQVYRESIKFDGVDIVATVTEFQQEHSWYRYAPRYAVRIEYGQMLETTTVAFDSLMPMGTQTSDAIRFCIEHVDSLKRDLAEMEPKPVQPVQYDDDFGF